MTAREEKATAHLIGDRLELGDALLAARHSVHLGGALWAHHLPDILDQLAASHARADDPDRAAKLRSVAALWRRRNKIELHKWRRQYERRLARDDRRRRQARRIDITTDTDRQEVSA